MAVLDLVEHALHRIIVVHQGFADAGRQPCIVNEFTQALASESKVVGAGAAAFLSLLFRPGPFWQRGVRPLPDAH